MTKGEALHTFFSSFGMTAYPTTAVPEDVIFPWLSYDAVIGNFGETVPASASVWFHTDSEAVLNRKAEEIAERIGLGGVQLRYDGGVIWIKRGTPWSTPVTDNLDKSIKRRVLNLEIDFM